MAQAVTTKADPGATGWAIRDPVTRLRHRGDDHSIVLEGSGRLHIGTASECAIRLAEGLSVSRQHACLERQGEEWIITDLDSTNGTRQDGEDRASFALAPAMEVELGRAKLIAESARSIALWELLRRWLGWSRDRLADVDSALHSVRQMGNLRAALLIVGDGPIAGTARRLYRVILDDDRPFSVHDPGETAAAAVERARDGMVVFDADELPPDFALALATCRLPDWRVRLVIGASSPKSAALISTKLRAVGTIEIPSFADRKDEIDQLLLAYAQDAARSLGAPTVALRPQDLSWVRAGSLKNLEEADEVMSRLVAVRNWGVTAGAARLGFTHGAFSKYFRRRKIPT